MQVESVGGMIDAQGGQIKRIHLQNFKCHDNFVIDFTCALLALVYCTLSSLFSLCLTAQYDGVQAPRELHFWAKWVWQGEPAAMLSYKCRGLQIALMAGASCWATCPDFIKEQPITIGFLQSTLLRSFSCSVQ